MRPRAGSGPVHPREAPSFAVAGVAECARRGPRWRSVPTAEPFMLLVPNQLQRHLVANTPAHNLRNLGFAAAGQLTLYESLTALHFRSKRHCTYDFHRTLGRPRAPVSLVWGSLRRAPGLDFRLLLIVHVMHTRPRRPGYRQGHGRGLRSSRGWPFAFEYSWRTCSVNATTPKGSREQASRYRPRKAEADAAAGVLRAAGVAAGDGRVERVAEPRATAKDTVGA